MTRCSNGVSFRLAGALVVDRVRKLLEVLAVAHLSRGDHALVVAVDEGLDHVARIVVGELDRGRLHEVGRRPHQRSGHAAVHGELAAADRVDHDARRGWRVPDLELELHVERYVAEGLALAADVSPLAVRQPGDVVRGADMDRAAVHLVVELRDDRVGLGYLLGLKALALEHVLEVHVAADVQLAGPLERDAPVVEEPRQHAVHDRRSDLALDVVAYDGKPRAAELALPHLFLRDEDRDAVDHAATGLEGLADVEARRVLAADRQVVDEHFRAGLEERLRDVDHRRGALRDGLSVVLAEAVQGGAAQNLDSELRHLRELHRVVGLREYRFAQVLADLVRVHVERGHELHVPYVVRPDHHVHDPGYSVPVACFAVVLDPLYQGRCAVARTHYCNFDFSHSQCLLAYPSRPG